MELSKLNIKFLPGVGEKRAALLQGELGIVSYEDMIYHVPYKYIDRSRIYPVAELNARMPYIQIKARIRNLKMTGEGKARRGREETRSKRAAAGKAARGRTEGK